MRLAGRVRRVEAVVDMQPVGCSGTNELVVFLTKFTRRGG